MLISYLASFLALLVVAAGASAAVLLGRRSTAGQRLEQTIRAFRGVGTAGRRDARRSPPSRRRPAERHDVDGAQQESQEAASAVR